MEREREREGEKERALSCLTVHSGGLEEYETPAQGWINRPSLFLLFHGNVIAAGLNIYQRYLLIKTERQRERVSEQVREREREREREASNVLNSNPLH